MYVYEGECRKCRKRTQLSDNDMGGSRRWDGICGKCQREEQEAENAEIDAKTIEERLKRVEEVLEIRNIEWWDK